MKLIEGLIFSSVIAYVSYRRNSLTRGGAAAAIVIGTIVYSFGSLFWYSLLLAFFISSSLLSHFKKEGKKKAEKMFAKSGKRDEVQVLANGGLAAILVLFSYAAEDPLPFMYCYLGVMATVNADTWGTELGILSRTPPRHILTWKKITAGCSGGVSGWGTLASLLGAVFIGGCATVLRYIESGIWEVQWIWIGAVAGLLGSIADSLLGSTAQRMYHCRHCGGEVEKRVHCGDTAHPIRGWASNDGVNALSSVIGGGIAWGIWELFY